MILPFNNPEPIDFRRRPLVGAPGPRRLSRAACLAIGLLAGTLLGMFFR